MKCTRVRGQPSLEDCEGGYSHEFQRSIRAQGERPEAILELALPCGTSRHRTHPPGLQFLRERRGEFGKLGPSGRLLALVSCKWESLRQHGGELHVGSLGGSRKLHFPDDYRRRFYGVCP